MLRKFIILLLPILVLNSCVSAKVYKDLESKYAKLRSQNRDLSSDLSTAQKALEDCTQEYNETKTALDQTTARYAALERDYASAKANLDNLQASYAALEANSSASIAENVKQNRALLAQLEVQQKALDESKAKLDTERKRLERLQQDLAERSARVDELERVIAAKDAAMRALKDAISSALTDFEGKGLTVEQRDGKVYVSLENKLLFASGSWNVGANGRRAVEQLGAVLANNPEIAVLIEGHTDDVPYSGSGNLSGNWDLSAKRATAIVKILRENTTIDPKNLTAAGRGQYAPVAPNDSPENKAKNRRIEVILTPKLDEITALLKDVN
ncbi:MAG: cell envelope biogenesis protein OmpA [Cytophagaceae bacterium]|nr:cell envelope biogenesis protein OmpA [Cytophagaceae bacterium]